jgi:hypothetical protein
VFVVMLHQRHIVWCVAAHLQVLGELRGSAKRALLGSVPCLPGKASRPCFHKQARRSMAVGSDGWAVFHAPTPDAGSTENETLVGNLRVALQP